MQNATKSLRKIHLRPFHNKKILIYILSNTFPLLSKSVRIFQYLFVIEACNIAVIRLYSFQLKPTTGTLFL